MEDGFKVTVDGLPEGAQVYHLELKAEKTNEQTELLLSLEDVDVVIDYYWDSHGRLIEWDGPNGRSRDEFHANTLKIVKETYTLKYEYGGDMDWEVWHLYVDGSEMKDIGEITSYNKRKKLFLKSVMGAG